MSDPSDAAANIEEFMFVNSIHYLVAKFSNGGDIYIYHPNAMCINRGL